MGKPKASSKSDNSQMKEYRYPWYLSPNPDKAWAEVFFVKYSVVWPILFGLWCASGLHLLVGDTGNLAVTVLISSPNVLYPLYFCPTKKPVVETFWFKYLVWIFIFTFVATYFWTEYFFDV
jgi:cycloeucalenol cycloisomerase